MAENDKQTEKAMETHSHKHDMHKKKFWLIGAGVLLGAFIVFLFAAASMWFGPRMHTMQFGRDLDDGGRTSMVSGRGGMQGGGMMRGGYNYDSNTMVNGVATAVSDSEMTVIGNGVSKKVALNSSTTYGANKPKVNDSIAVRGTTSGDTFTATSVQVVNR